jgi:DNA (cytosine-5)-methyltransferase 1
LIVVDLFAGAGGGTTSLLRAASKMGLNVQIIAVNHWQTAVDTHALNHPGHVHYCDPVEAVHPRIAVPCGKIFALIAGPSCVHFSRARGGEPKDDQQRAGAWQVFKWAEELNPEVILVENVPDFLTWGPLDSAGRPIKDGLGAEFLRWIGALEKLGYRVEWRVLCAADYGDPTKRNRLFIQATRGRIKWPLPSHCDPKILKSFPSRQSWRTAEEIINFDMPSKRIVGRKKRLADATVARFVAGIRSFWGDEFAYDFDTPGPHPWLDRPIPFTARRILKLAESGVMLPFLVKYHGGDHSDRRFLSVKEPMATVDGSNRFGLLQPFLVKYYGGHTADTIYEPVGTLTASYEHYGLLQPFLIGVGGPRSLHREISLQSPLRSQLSQNHLALVQPFIIPFFGERDGQTARHQSLRAPLATVTGQGAGALLQPFLISYYGNGSECSIAAPMPTATGRDRFALVEGRLCCEWPHWAIDLHLRMLDPEELKLAHSFGPDYQFCGTRADQVKQIGNSWPCGMGEALSGAILEGVKNGGAS